MGKHLKKQFFNVHPSTLSRRAAQYGSILLALSAAANAQDPQLFPEAAPPSPPSTPKAPPSRSPASFYASSDATASSALVHEQVDDFWGFDPFAASLNNPFQWGPFQLRPFGTYRFTYGDGLNVSPGNQVTTALHAITPGAILSSRHLSFRYAPTLKYYSSENFKDGVDHAASANAFFGAGDWLFNLGHSFNKSRSPLVETGAQTPRQRHSTILSALYRHSQKTSFEFSLNQSIREAEAFNSSKNWSSMNWANYHWSEAVLAGVGVGGGYTMQDFGADMTHETIQARIGWAPGSKLSINLNGGVEFRQFVDSFLDDQLNPVYGASIFYSPWEATTFSLQANRSVGSSLLRAQTTESTSIAAGVRQRFLEVLHLDLFASFTQRDYQGVTAQSGGVELQTNRTDEDLSLSVSVGTRIFEKGDISVFYERSENQSTVEGLTYDSNQYGFQIAYHF